MKLQTIYKLVFEVNNVYLTYTALILEEDLNFVTFRDVKYNDVFTYQKSKLVSAKEMSQ